MVECTKSWQPNKLCVVWTRRSRRKTSELLSWQPTIQNPYRGLVVWPVPENVEITVTLFQDPKATEYEDKVRTVRGTIHQFVRRSFDCPAITLKSQR